MDPTFLAFLKFILFRAVQVDPPGAQQLVVIIPPINEGEAPINMNEISPISNLTIELFDTEAPQHNQPQYRNELLEVTDSILNFYIIVIVFLNLLWVCFLKWRHILLVTFCLVHILSNH